MFGEKDLQEIRARGMTPEEVIAQIRQFKRGFPFTRLDRPCTAGDGIRVLSRNEVRELGNAFAGASFAGRAMKFVPASGAASRMFKSLLDAHHRLSELPAQASAGEEKSPDPTWGDLLEFMDGLRKYAFHDDLRSVMARDGLDLEAELACSRYGLILDYALTPRGLNLTNLPKGLIKFHLYPPHARSAFEEQLVEGALYAQEKEGHIRIHFTLSPEHRSMVTDHIEKVRSFHERQGTTYDISFSLQDPSTDTLAVDMNDEPFRDREGRLVFRPGGHGALLQNVNELRGDLIFVKNIDNVAPDWLKPDTVAYKKALGGYLLDLLGKAYGYLERLREGPADDRLVDEALEFLRDSLSVTPPDRVTRQSRDDVSEYITRKLNRPLRVCGMVKNEGEPGGGPFWVRRSKESLSLQIVESSQVNMKSSSQRSVWESATHFNPVDLVCGVRDYMGRPFNLMEFRDPDTGFISVKSKEGRELKALELPGLWNGSMAHWNTAFVEVPSTTFSPVKTVLDLLRQEHQP
ncbi:MAG: DUF4301 family protein [Deltaproteobacteria bacterium]|nr:DUF4301 family protein [Deltaproteobacteria bacterium]